MYEALFGNKTAGRILLHLHRRQRGYATEISRELEIPLNMVQKQLDRLAWVRLLIIRFENKKKIYFWNRSLPFYLPMRRLLGAIANTRAVDHPLAADGSHLSLKERVREADALYRQAVRLNPYGRYRPFVKTFDDFKNYESWKKRQKNPWLV